MRLLDFDDGFGSASFPTQGFLTSTRLQAYSSDASYVSFKGNAATQGDQYYNTTNDVIRHYHNVRGWVDLIDTYNIFDFAPNYCLNGNFKSATDGWVTYKDAAGIVPVDGSGGTSTLTLTQQTGTTWTFNGETGGKLNNSGGSNKQGEGLSYDTSVGVGDVNKPIYVNFDYITSGTGSDGDWKVFVYAFSNSTLLNVYNENDGDLIHDSASDSTESRQFKGEFIGNGDGIYRVIVHRTTTSTSNDTLYIGNVEVTTKKDSTLGRLLTATSSVLTPTGSAQYHNMSGNTVTLLKNRKYKVSGMCQFDKSGTPGYTQIKAALYWQDGNNNATVPTLLGSISGVYIETATPSHTGQFETVVGSDGPFYHQIQDVIIKCDSDTQIFLVPFTTQTTSGDARITTYLNAEAIS